MLKKYFLAAALAGIVALTPFRSSATPAFDRCPRIHEAIHALDVAREELQRADHDFCGQRVAALRDIDAALARLHNAERCDRCR
jgi:hypothetical protein